MKKKIEDIDGSIKTYTHRHGDLTFPEGWDDEIIKVSNRFIQKQRNEKIDKLLNED